MMFVFLLSLEKQQKIEAKRAGKVSHKHIIQWTEGGPSSPEEEAFWSHFGGKPESLPEKSEYQIKKANENAGSCSRN